MPGTVTLVLGTRIVVVEVVPTLCDPMDYSVYRILQTRILEWVAFPSPGALPNPGTEPSSPTLQQILHYLSHHCFPSPEYLSNPGIKPGSPALQVDSLPAELPRKPHGTAIINFIYSQAIITHALLLLLS